MVYRITYYEIGEGKRMEKKEKSTKKQALSDRLAEMPKETKGQRIKYLLEKHGMTQRELAKKTLRG